MKLCTQPPRVVSIVYSPSDFALVWLAWPCTSSALSGPYTSVTGYCLLYMPLVPVCSSWGRIIHNLSPLWRPARAFCRGVFVEATVHADDHVHLGATQCVKLIDLFYQGLAAPAESCYPLFVSPLLAGCGIAHGLVRDWRRYVPCCLHYVGYACSLGTNN